MAIALLAGPIIGGRILAVAGRRAILRTLLGVVGVMATNLVSARAVKWISTTGLATGQPPWALCAGLY